LNEVIKKVTRRREEPDEGEGGRGI